MMRWLLFAEILLGYFHYGFTEVSFCPQRETIYPCECNHGLLDSPPSISCEGVSGIEKIQHVLKNTKGLNIYSFTFRKSRLGDIPSDFFAGQQFVHLSFYDCQIGSFGDRPFTGLEDSLDSIRISGHVNKARIGLESFRLSHLKKLTHLTLIENKIKRLGNEWFESGPPEMETLMIEFNDIEELGDRAFAALTNIERIFLKRNRFQKVSRTMFPRPATKLHTLEMSHSQIDELPEDFFEDMPALKSVNVAVNNLKSIPESTWGKIWDQLDEVYLHRNSDFECDENLKWIFNRKLPKILTGKCTDEKHYGKEIRDLTLADFE